MGRVGMCEDLLGPHFVIVEGAEVDLLVGRGGDVRELEDREGGLVLKHHIDLQGLGSILGQLLDQQIQSRHVVGVVILAVDRAVFANQIDLLCLVEA